MSLKQSPKVGNILFYFSYEETEEREEKKLTQGYSELKSKPNLLLLRIVQEGGRISQHISNWLPSWLMMEVVRVDKMTNS